jgi:signal transduction histidine kinase
VSKGEPPARGGKLGKAEIMAQSREVQGERLLSLTLDRLQGLIAVVNEQNQIIYANGAFAEFFGRSAEELCGMRPGEVFHCVRGSDEGCGNSPGCRFCGTLQAIRETQETFAPATRECSITGAFGGRITAYEFLVRTMPFAVSGTRYILVSFREISSQKRRVALERIFFHDILNTASSIKVYLDLLKAGMTDDGSRPILERLEGICNTLVEEIQSQKILVSAENKTLTVQKNLILSNGIVEQVAQAFEGQDIAHGKKIAMAPFSEAFSFVSDDSLVKRVLSNMVKNALEASPEGAAVTVGFRKEDSRLRFWVHNPSYIEEDVRRQIFQRYFSTKGPDRGLGTFSIKLLTEEYLQGSVAVESTREEGTTFSITLPLRP